MQAFCRHSLSPFFLFWGEGAATRKLHKFGEEMGGGERAPEPSS